MCSANIDTFKAILVFYTDLFQLNGFLTLNDKGLNAICLDFRVLSKAHEHGA